MKIKNLFLMAALALMAAVSCAKTENPSTTEDSISVDKASLTFDATGAPAQTVTVTASGKWTFSVDSKNPWLKVLAMTGSDSTLSVSAEANESTTDARSGSFTVTCGTKTATVTVSQAAAAPSAVGVYIKIGTDEPVELKESAAGTGIYTATVDRPATGNFVFIIDGEEYGFVKRSGAGGIGEDCTDANSGLPVEFRDADATLKAEYKLGVNRAIGAITKEEARCPFWLNYSAAGKMNVGIAKSQMAYMLENVSNEANVILNEQFDLVITGGSYSAPFKTYEVTLDAEGKADALLPVKESSGNYTTGDFNGGVWAGSDETATLGLNKNFLSQLAIEEWIGLSDSYFQLQYNCIQIGGTGVDTTGVYTPKFSKISGSADVKVTLDMFRFAPATTMPIYIDVIGGGQITEGSTTADYNDWNDRTPKTEDWNVTTPVTRHALPDNDYFAHTYNWNDSEAASVNAKLLKPISHMNFTIKGATADTQLYISAHHSGKSKGGQRFQIHGLKVVKQ